MSHNIAAGQKQSNLSVRRVSRPPSGSRVVFVYTSKSILRVASGGVPKLFKV